MYRHGVDLADSVYIVGELVGESNAVLVAVGTVNQCLGLGKGKGKGKGSVSKGHHGV